MVQVSKDNTGDGGQESRLEFTVNDLLAPGVEVTARGKPQVILSATYIPQVCSPGRPMRSLQRPPPPIPPRETRPDYVAGPAVSRTSAVNNDRYEFIMFKI